MGALSLVLLFSILFILGVPIVFALGLTSLLTIMFFTGLPFDLIPGRLLGGVQSPTLMAVILYILAAEFMTQSTITKRIFDFSNKIVGHWIGGLGHVNVVASMIFAGMSGSALADAAGLGRIEIEAMVGEGYDKNFSAAITAVSCTIGPIIPPSIIMVVYGAMAEQSLARLFLGGIIPGILMGVGMMAIIFYQGKRKGLSSLPRAPLKSVLISFIKTIPPLGTPVIILGGIASGIFTPTESGALAVLYAFILSTFYYKDIKIKDIYRIIVRAAINSANVLVIFGFATVFSTVFTFERIPDLVLDLVMSITTSGSIAFLLIIIISLIGGMFMQPTPLLLIIGPMLIPVASAFGINLVHYGIVMIVALMIGLITPPFAMALYIVKDIAKTPFWEIFREVLPFYIPLIILLFLMAYIPGLVMWLPNLIMGQ